LSFLRRSTRRLAILLLTLSLSAPAADAIQLGRAVALGVGVTWPMQPDQFKEFWNAGVALSAGFMFEPAPRLSVGIEVGYYRHEFDSNAFEAALSDSIPQVSVGGRYFPARRRRDLPAPRSQSHGEWTGSPDAPGSGAAGRAR
jgi:hypothetical protein